MKNTKEKITKINFYFGICLFEAEKVESSIAHLCFVERPQGKPSKVNSYPSPGDDFDINF